MLTDVTEAHRLRPGDVLVTRQTDPGWGAVFPLISGLVMERGGMLSHGAIIAREFGIPSVVGITDATRLIPHGALVQVDGDRGLVRVTAERIMIARWTAYWLERFRPVLFVPVAILLAAAVRRRRHRADPRRWTIDIFCALLLLGQFRLWDDLADRERDRAAHPSRVLVGATRTRALRRHVPDPRDAQHRPRRSGCEARLPRPRSGRARRRRGRLGTAGARRDGPPRPI